MELPEVDPVAQFMNLDRWDDESPMNFNQEDVDATPSPPLTSTETYMIGYVRTKIVGVQYYTGTINGREMVGLVREPLNQFDANAIRVINTQTLQVGHIERTVAAVLAPLIDDNLITVEGIVPTSAGRARSVNRLKISCQVHVFARYEAFSIVNSALSQGELEFVSNVDVGFTLSEAVVVKQRREEQVRSLDEIFKCYDENVSKRRDYEALEPPEAVIISKLFAHQKEGLGWLVHRENSGELPPFWEMRGLSYVNVLTGHATSTRPEPLRGGIFADDMGLGKTLTLLSLIAFDKCGSSLAWSAGIGSVIVNSIDEIGIENEGVSIFGGGKRKRGGTSKTGNDVQKSCKTNGGCGIELVSRAILEASLAGVFDESSNGSGLKTTLIVFPPSVFATWMTQLEEHTRHGSLKVYAFYGSRTRDVEVLKQHDIVLTTYSTLVSEESMSDSPVKKMEWWRVILDEAHIIKNASSKMCQAVTNLNAKRRWAVTGTPIQNGTYDLFSLVTFLHFEPFSVKNYWQSLVNRPLSEGSETGLKRLQAVMAAISLRRTKDKAMIGLPPKIIETYFVELSGEERKLYDGLEADAKNVVRDYINSGLVVRNYTTILSIILRLRQICTNVALCPADVKLLFSPESIADVSKEPELLRKMVSALQDGEDLDCPICICPPIDIVITVCAHIFCRPCIMKSLNSKTCCPLCRHNLSPTEDLYSAPPEPSDTDNTETSSCKSSTSSKVSALLRLLVASRNQNPNRKSVVFSQFQKMLVLLEEPLKAAGFKILRLDGSMNAKRRARIIEEFGVRGPETPTVMLASLKTSSAGINLTAASRVYLLEPWWNPAVEEQAMDRVHRIGQKEDVKIVRLIAKNSIEERILELQEKKKMLSREASRTKGDKKEVSLDELRTLMAL